jgi:hypothetical protein
MTVTVIGTTNGACHVLDAAESAFQLSQYLNTSRLAVDAAYKQLSTVPAIGNEHSNEAKWGKKQLVFP